MQWLLRRLIYESGRGSGFQWQGKRFTGGCCRHYWCWRCFCSWNILLIAADLYGCNKAVRLTKVGGEILRRRKDLIKLSVIIMASELVIAATNEKLNEMDWMKNIEICELVSRDPGIIEKVAAALEVLRDVVNAIDSQHPEVQVNDENVVSQAIKLNEQLQNVLARHDALLSVNTTSTASHFAHEEAEEEEG
ncbi:hypothetical protein IFM89_019984 [Coptis chinensis]|uniref:VHS domain-containing protein n=1 Tax=Coptis chinensis TaxID=261450 RepID=A0A835M0U5_9MAGN|nr:hypothetical protein IFM89_019984 [Coptis chinensis]